MGKDIVSEMVMSTLLANDPHPAERKVRILLTHRGCPFGAMAKRAVLEFNRKVPPERRVEIINLYTVDGRIVSEFAEHPLVSAILEKYGVSRCPTLIFDGGVYQGILDDEEYYYFLRKLDEMF